MENNAADFLWISKLTRERSVLKIEIVNHRNWRTRCSGIPRLGKKGCMEVFHISLSVLGKETNDSIYEKWQTQREVSILLISEMYWVFDRNNNICYICIYMYITHHDHLL